GVNRGSALPVRGGRPRRLHARRDLNSQPAERCRVLPRELVPLVRTLRRAVAGRGSRAGSPHLRAGKRSPLVEGQPPAVLLPDIDTRHEGTEHGRLSGTVCGPGVDEDGTVVTGSDQSRIADLIAAPRRGLVQGDSHGG